jgi:hypothetical protein
VSVAAISVLAIFPALASKQGFTIAISPTALTVQAGTTLTLYPGQGQGVFVTSNGITAEFASWREQYTDVHPVISLFLAQIPTQSAS